MFRLIITGICLILSGQIVQAQHFEDLSYYADICLNASAVEHRERANEEMSQIFDEILESGDAFNFPFDSIPYMLTTTPTDSSFKLITYPLKDDPYQYYGYIIMNNGQYFKLNDQSHDLWVDANFMELDAETWLGAMYYKMIEQTVNGENLYFLFGYNGFEASEQIKIVDVLSFQNGIPSFGKPVFQTKRNASEFQNRITLFYAQETEVSLNYNPNLGMIMHDHLIAGKSMMDNKMVMFSDGSYEGYLWQENKWIYKEKLFDQVSKEAPRPNPVLDGRKQKDLFGK